MTPERFRELWFDAHKEVPPTPVELSTTSRAWQLHLREALTAFVESEAMREKAEHQIKVNFDGGVYRTWDDYYKGKQDDADWIKASWEKWLGRTP